MKYDDSKYYLSDREGLAAALATMKHCEVYAKVPLDVEGLDDDILLQYFNADENDAIIKEVEKIIQTATVNTVYSKNYIPAKRKEDFARSAVKQQMEILQVGRLNYQEQTGKRHGKAVAAELKENKMAKRISMIDLGVKRGVRIGVKTGISAGLGALVSAFFGTPVAVPAYVIYGIITVIPDKVKKPIVEVAKKVVDEVVIQVRQMADNLVEKGVEIGQKVGGFIKKTGKKIKGFFKKIFN